MQPINTALCSFGMSGKVFHAPFLQANPHFRFYGVWERSKQSAATYYPDVKSFATYDEMLSDEQIELVIVNTPNYTHYEYATKALQAGKHVIVEKPFVTTVAEGSELMALAEKQNRLLSIYHNRRWDSDYQTVKKVVEEGWLGDIVEAEIHFDRFKEELSPKKHKETPGKGTGVLYDLGSHLVDQALGLFGPPNAVFADIRTVRPISQVDDYFELLLYYPELRVRLHSSYLVREAGPGFILHGSKGSFLKSRADVQEARLTAGDVPEGADWGMEPESENGWLHTEKDGAVIREHIPTVQGNYNNYYTAVYEAVRLQHAPPVPAHDALAVIQIIEAAFQSSAQGTVVELAEWPV